MVLLMGGVLVLAAELLNTSIERTVDYISMDQDVRARDAKDVGSAGVAMTAVAVGVAWLVVLLG
jgi:diacylglycerol kinase (ATP)